LFLNYNRENFLKFFFVFFLTYSTMEGVARFLLFSSGLGIFAYSIKGIMLIAILWRFNTCDTEKIFLVFSITVLFFFNGIYINGFNSVTITLFSFIPLLFFYLYPISTFIDKISGNTLFFLIVILLVGLLIDLSFPVIWKGFSSEINGISVVGNKEWTLNGVSRLAGFGRSSIESATILAFLCLLYTIQNNKSFLKPFVITLSIYGIYLTTTKGAMLALIISLLYYFIPPIFTIFKTVILIIMVLLGNFILLVTLFELNASFFETNFYSIYLRIIDTWPDVFILINKSSNFLGLGFGGVGIASPGGGPADNFWLFIMAMFGFISWFILLTLVLLSCPILSKFKLSPLYLFFFSYGITNNMIESITGQAILALILFDIFRLLSINKKIAAI
jgi:hypothetical protein